MLKSSITTYSDQRDKTDIVDLKDGLDVINLLKPRKFTWANRVSNANDGKTVIGFVAQEVDEALGDKNDYIRMVNKLDPDQLHCGSSRTYSYFNKGSTRTIHKSHSPRSRVNCKQLLFYYGRKNRR